MKKTRGKNIHIIVLILLIVLLLVYYYIEKNIKPTLASICEVKAKIIATQIINDTVRSELENDEMKEQILMPTFDNEGKINMIRTDALAMNTISSSIAQKVQEKIVSLKDQNFSIPLGAALDSQLLATMGPKLKFSIMHEGSVIVDFKTEFEESGINQTRYKIYITVSVDIRVISPVITSDMTVNNNVLIAEIVIVGDVPESYMKLPLMQ